MFSGKDDLNKIRNDKDGNDGECVFRKVLEVKTVSVIMLIK